MDAPQETSCYTYKVEMVVHIFAPTQEEASDRLDNNGGYVSKRSTKLIDAVTVSLAEDSE